MDQPPSIQTAIGSSAALGIVYSSLSLRRQRQAWLTVGLMLVGAFAEVVSVGSILPFLAVLTNPDRLASIPIVGGLIASLPPGTDLVTLTATVFISLFILSGLLRLYLAWVSQSLAFNIAYDLSVIAFGKLIRQPYPYHVERHSGEALSQFEKLNNVTFSILLAGSQSLISTVVAALLIALLVVVNPVVALISAGVLISAYLLFSFAVRPTLHRNSIVGNLHLTLRIKRIQEALGGIRDILLDRSQPAFEREFERSADRLRYVNSLNAIIGLSPRILIEMLGMVMIGAYAWYLSAQPGGLAAEIPMLGALALGAQRLLPLLQQSYSGWSSFLGSREILREVVDLLLLTDRTPPARSPGTVAFRDTIAFDHVGFTYPVGDTVLHDISFTIRKGERLGIAGTTGSGKSTLMDLLLGLLDPREGSILIDGHRLDDSLRAGWQAQIAHVPQSIYLTDDTLAANIAFGVPEDQVDPARIEAAATSAGIGEFIDRLPDRFATRTGERGIRLSGGQRQRIGIARALYKQASILVFDEATSALDTRTEEGVMRSIAGLDPEITIVLIAHRLTTLKDCDRIIHLEGGRIAKLVEQAARSTHSG